MRFCLTECFIDFSRPLQQDRCLSISGEKIIEVLALPSQVRACAGHLLVAPQASAIKVIEDKVTVYPPHAICRADVSVILSAPPAEWVVNIETVRLSAGNSHPQ